MSATITVHLTDVSSVDVGQQWRSEVHLYLDSNIFVILALMEKT